MGYSEADRPRDVFECSPARLAMLNQKAEVVRAMPEWKPEAWRRLNENERWEVIARTEEKFAALERREVVPTKELEAKILAKLVKPDELAPHGITRERHGNPVDIQISRKLILETEPDRAMLAYFHEEHHVEQLQAIRSPESRPDFSRSQIEAWQASRTHETVNQTKRDISYQEYKGFAHEQSSQLEAARLYARCLNDAPPVGGSGHIERADQQPNRDAADHKAVQEAKRQQALDALTRLNQEHEQKNTPSRDPSRKPER